MSLITRPVISDETGKRIAAAVSSISVQLGVENSSETGPVNPISNLLEVVDSFTATEDAISHTFNLNGERGSFIVISDPPGNISNTLNMQSVPTYGVLSMAYFEITGDPKVIRNARATTIRPEFESTGYIDYLESYYVLDENTVELYPLGTSRTGYIAGITYYLLKIKGM